MKITKAMGLACLDELLDEDVKSGATQAVDEFIGTNSGTWPLMEPGQFNLILAMCAAIAGVKPEDVE